MNVIVGKVVESTSRKSRKLQLDKSNKSSAWNREEIIHVVVHTWQVSISFDADWTDIILHGSTLGVIFFLSTLSIFNQLSHQFCIHV
jgi:hypothetical protein